MVCCFYGMGILVTIVQFRSTSIMLPGKRGFADATWSSKLAVLGLIGTKVTFNIPPYLVGTSLDTCLFGTLTATISVLLMCN